MNLTKTSREKCTKWFPLRDKRVKNGLDFDLSSDKTNIREDKIATGSIY